MFTVFFASLDWVMSIEPHWFSSVFGAWIVAGNANATLGMLIISLIITNAKVPNPWMTKKNLHDIGKLLFMTVLLWAYLSLSQFLIIWAGNLPEETFWYYERSVGMWHCVSTFIPVCQFVIPFLVLLPRNNKTNPRVLIPIIILMLCVRVLETVWLVTPSVRQEGAVIHWMDFAAPLGLGGVWFAIYFQFLNGSFGVPHPLASSGAYSGSKGPQDKPHKEGGH
jgi:hypothetical protein